MESTIRVIRGICKFLVGMIAGLIVGLIVLAWLVGFGCLIGCTIERVVIVEYNAAAESPESVSTQPAEPGTHWLDQDWEVPE